MCEYQSIDIPFSLKFHRMSKKEVNAYFSWYMIQIPKRVATLERAVICTPNFEEWMANYLAESLDMLGEWFAFQVERRKLTQTDRDKMNEGVPDRIKKIPLPEWVLTDRTYSIAIDIGMYLSEVMLKHIPGLKWQSTANIGRTYIDYGHPVLVGPDWPKWYTFNPTKIMISKASSIADGRWESSELRKIFEYWRQPPKEQEKLK